MPSLLPNKINGSKVKVEMNRKQFQSIHIPSTMYISQQYFLLHYLICLLIPERNLNDHLKSKNKMEEINNKMIT